MGGLMEGAKVPNDTVLFPTGLSKNRPIAQRLVASSLGEGSGERESRRVQL